MTSDASEIPVTPFREAHSNLLAEAILAASSPEAKSDVVTVLAGALGKAVFLLSGGGVETSKAMFKIAISTAAAVAAEMHAEAAAPRRRAN